MNFSELPLPQDAANPMSFGPVRDVFARARGLDLDLYMVGGYLRDCLSPKACRRESSAAYDFDFCVVSEDTVGFARNIADLLGGHFVLLDNKNDCARVVCDDGVNLDFAGCVGGSIENDLKRRDFTINAFAFSPSNPDVILDMVGGFKDLESRKIRHINEKNLVDDPLRLLRAFRFAAQLSFEIDQETISLIEKHASKLKAVPFERINHELFILLAKDESFPLMEKMAETGLLENIFFELSETRKVTANQFHHLGLFEHSLEAVHQLEIFFQATDRDWVKKSAQAELCHGVSRLSATKLATLLHDIGKPATWKVTDEGRHTFLGHDNVGYEMIQEMASEKKWPRPLSKFIANLVKWHLRPGQLFHQCQPTERALNRFYRTVGAEVPELMLLAFGDLGATRGADFSENARENLKESFKNLLDGYLLFVEKEKKLPKLLDGNQIMQLLGVEPGPHIGEILNALEEAQSLDEVSDQCSAEAFVRDLYAKRSSN